MIEIWIQCEAHINDNLDVGRKLECFSFDQKSTDRWMMADLLEIDMHITKFALKGLTKDRIEWFLYSWICSIDEHQRTCHIFHLFDKVSSICYFISIGG